MWLDIEHQADIDEGATTVIVIQRHFFIILLFFED